MCRLPTWIIVPTHRYCIVSKHACIPAYPRLDPIKAAEYRAPLSMHASSLSSARVDVPRVAMASAGTSVRGHAVARWQRSDMSGGRTTASAFARRDHRGDNDSERASALRASALRASTLRRRCSLAAVETRASTVARSPGTCNDHSRRLLSEAQSLALARCRSCRRSCHSQCTCVPARPHR